MNEWLILSFFLSLISGEVAPGQKVKVELSFLPVRAGVRKLLVDFDSDRLKDVKGVATVVVRQKYTLLNPRFIWEI